METRDKPVFSWFENLVILHNNQGLWHKNRVLTRNLVFAEPVTNPWQTHDLPVINHVLKHGFGAPETTSKNIDFLVFFCAFLVSGLGLRH